MPLASRLKTLALAAAISVTPALAWLAETPAPNTETRPHVVSVQQPSGLDPTARTEEEFDRKFGMCRRC